MPLLITTNPTAQMQIMNGICCVMTTHSENSRRFFRHRLELLAGEDGLQAVLTSCIQDRQHIEFGLCWYPGNGSDDHPQHNGHGPARAGELVYQPFSDLWSIHIPE